LEVSYILRIQSYAWFGARYEIRIEASEHILFENTSPDRSNEGNAKCRQNSENS
jgi:hypothetical protein